MKVVYDTSSIIALLIEDHPHHDKALQTYLKLIEQDAEFYICSHSIAEIFSTVTKGVRYLDYTAEQASDLINRDLEILFSVVDLNKSDYISVVQFLQAENLTGAIIYDALIVQSATKIEAEYIVTLNIKHFKQLGGLTGADFIRPA